MEDLDRSVGEADAWSSTTLVTRRHRATRRAQRAPSPCGGVGEESLRPTLRLMPLTQTSPQRSRGRHFGRAKRDREPRFHLEAWVLGSRCRVRDDSFASSNALRRGLDLVPEVGPLRGILDGLQPDDLVVRPGARELHDRIAETLTLGQRAADLFFRTV